MLKLSSVFLMILLMCCIGACDRSKAIISDYHPTFIPGYDTQGNLQIAIRMYYVQDIAYFLLVDPNTFVTKIIPLTNFKSRRLSSVAVPGYYTMASLQNTSYLKALERYSSPPYLLQNYGLTHSQHPMQGVFLTIDMCPSGKSFEEIFFKALVARSNKTKNPIPIGLSMSGLWMTSHDKELNWLIAQSKANKLAITWINHSFSHIYYRDLPLEKNFMLNRRGDFKEEILETEKILLQKHQLPSVFFRYPGLVSDQALSLKLRELGLIPVGSNAWLAKGETAKNGSIILVHGNSNEPLGIQEMRVLLEQPNLNFLPLSQAILG
jgi:hypothetical protein